MLGAKGPVKALIDAIEELDKEVQQYCSQIASDKKQAKCQEIVEELGKLRNEVIGTEMAISKGQKSTEDLRKLVQELDNVRNSFTNLKMGRI